MTVLGLALFWLAIVTAQGRSFVAKRGAARGYGIPDPPASSISNASSIFNSKPIISNFHVVSNIEFRYARTSVESHVKNPGSTSQEIAFTAIIPNSAFISNFTMVFDGVEYVADVAAKEEAKKVYDEAVMDGRGAGLVAQDVRDSNKFSVNANVEPGAKVIFKMTYEELLQRKLGWYDHVINVNPGQIVDDLVIQVNIDESRPLAKLSVPQLKQSNDINFEPDQKNEIAQVEWAKGNATACIEFEPSKEQQEEYGEQGLAGQLHIKYDVERDDKDNEVQVIDGYFVHFFTPENLKTLPKHVIFVLDISGSMLGDKIVQLKDAMFTILDDMTEQDYFNIITFSSSFNHWQLPSKDAPKEQPKHVIPNFDFEYSTTGIPEIDMKKFELIQATDDNRKEAIKYTNSIDANGGTNINAGLLEGLKLAAEAKKNEALPTNLQSIIVFLSDGEPTSGVTNGDAIKENAKKANLQLKVPIYSLGFGRGADFNLIRGISADSDAFAKHIYEDSDAALQLEDFFAEIASPLLSDLKFNYVGGLVDNTSISQSHLGTFYKGGEFVVSGKLNNTAAEENDVLGVTVSAAGENGTAYDHEISICLRPCALPRENNMTGFNDIHYNVDVAPLQHTCPLFCSPPPPPPPPRSQAQNFLQKLHAFLNIKQLLKRTDDIINGTSPSKEKALKLSLANNFVTELTSLIVARPNETAKISSVSDANAPPSNRYNYRSFHNRGAAPSGRRTATFYSMPRPMSPPGPPGMAGPTGHMASPPSHRGYPNIMPPAQIPKMVYESAVYHCCASLDYFAYDGGVQSTSIPIMTTIDPCSGSITMFSKTYYRGENITVTDDTTDLGDFNDKVVSIKVEGTCCWKLYSLVFFQGDHKLFRKGDYKSTQNVGEMFRKASSVKKIMNC